MLFPVYWMVNVSLTPTGLMRKDPPNLIPLHATSTDTARSCANSCRTC